MYDFKAFCKAIKENFRKNPDKKIKSIILIIAYILYSLIFIIFPPEMLIQVTGEKNIISTLLIVPGVVLLIAIFTMLGINMGGSLNNKEDAAAGIFAAWLFFMILISTVLTPLVLEDISFGIPLLIGTLLILTLIIELALIPTRKMWKNKEAVEKLEAPDTNELTPQEVRLIQKMNTQSYLPIFSLAGIFMPLIIALIITMVIDIGNDMKGINASAGAFPVIAAIVPVIIYTVILCSTLIGTRTKLTGTKWATILMKLNNKVNTDNVEEKAAQAGKLAMGGITSMALGRITELAGNDKGQEMGDVAAGILAGIAVGKLSTATREHTKEVADLFGIKLASSRKVFVTFFLIPIILFTAIATTGGIYQAKKDLAENTIIENNVNKLVSELQENLEEEVYIAHSNKSESQIVVHTIKVLA